MSGDELCRKRDEQIFPDIPIILLRLETANRSGLPDLNQAPMTIFLNRSTRVSWHCVSLEFSTA